MKNKRIELFLYSKPINFIITFMISLACCDLSGFPTLESIIDMITLLFSMITILFYLLKCEISKISLSLIIFIVLQSVSSLLREKSSIVLLLKNYYKVVALAFYLDYGLKYYTKNIVKSFYLTYSILVLINFCTINDFDNMLFGHKNHHAFMYLPTLMFMFMNQYLEKRKLYIREYVLVLITIFGIFYRYSATSVCAYVIFLVYLLFEKYINKKEIFNSKTYFFAYIISFIGIVILRVQDAFSFIIVKVLGKKLTFSSRTDAWDKAIYYIKQRFFIGYGREENAWIAAKLGEKPFVHAHNTILDVLYKGGIMSLIMFGIMLTLPINQLYKYRKFRLTKLMSVILFCILIMMNFETRQESAVLYIALISCYNISCILKTNNEISNEQEK